MQNDDIVRTKDLSAVRASVLQARRRVLVTACVTPLLCALLVLMLLYRFTSLGSTASLVLTSVFVFGGVAVFVHWQRHYRADSTTKCTTVEGNIENLLWRTEA